MVSVVIFPHSTRKRFPHQVQREGEAFTPGPPRVHSLGRRPGAPFSRAGCSPDEVPVEALFPDFRQQPTVLEFVPQRLPQREGGLLLAAALVQAHQRQGRPHAGVAGV